MSIENLKKFDERMQRLRDAILAKAAEYRKSGEPELAEIFVKHVDDFIDYYARTGRLLTMREFQAIAGTTAEKAVLARMAREKGVKN